MAAFVKLAKGELIIHVGYAGTNAVNNQERTQKNAVSMSQ
jgi:hypothetical protein